MKKIIACLSLALAMSASMTAMAAGTATESNKTVTISGAGAYKTVLIKNNETGAIVYVDQATDAVSATAAYLIASDAAVGDYTAYLGGTDAAVQSLSFTVAAAPAAADEDMTAVAKVANGDNFDWGFTADAVDLSELGYIAVTASSAGQTDKTAYISVSDVFTSVASGDINVKLQITNVPDGVTVSAVFTATNN